MDGTEVKNSKPLNILDIAATDKENFTSDLHKKKIKLKNTKMLIDKKNKRNVELDNRITLKNKTATSHSATTVNCSKKEEAIQTATVLDSDLTIDHPSENYWKNLAETTKKALESALKENVDLHNKTNELEYEISCLKSMLNETKSLVEYLTEMIEGTSQDSDEDDTANEETSSKTQLENESLKSE